VVNATGGPFSHFAEAIRAINLAVDQIEGSQSSRVIGFTSALPSEGKSTLALAFAQLLAETGARVLLVDCDLRNPSLTQKLTPNATAGFVDTLAGLVPVERATWQDSSTDMVFLPGVLKAPLAHANQFLGCNQTKILFDGLRVQYDYIVVDFSPLAPVVDVRWTAELVDAYVLVIEWGKTTLEAVKHALGTAPLVREKIVGAVLNKADVSRLGRYEKFLGDYYKTRYAQYGQPRSAA
jgi:succinoglycan biosynthesis transport protein ExoP